MKDFFRGILLGLAAIALILALVFWSERPLGDPTIWFWRIFPLIVAPILIYLGLAKKKRPEKYEDMLAKINSNFHERDGFCFAFVFGLQYGVGTAQLYFQNRYAKPCNAKVVLSCEQSLFFWRPQMKSIVFRVDAPGASYGVVRVPIAIPIAAQGKKIYFNAGASIKYMEGRGEEVRFNEGIYVSDLSRMGNFTRIIFSILGGLVGILVLFRKRRLSVLMPSGAAEVLPVNAAPRVDILWMPEQQHTGGFPVIMPGS